MARFSFSNCERGARHLASRKGQPILSPQAIKGYAGKIQEATNGRGRRPGSETRRTQEIQPQRSLETNGKVDVRKAAPRYRQDQAQKAPHEEEVSRRATLFRAPGISGRTRRRAKIRAAASRRQPHPARSLSPLEPAGPAPFNSASSSAMRFLSGVRAASTSEGL